MDIFVYYDDMENNATSITNINNIHEPLICQREKNEISCDNYKLLICFLFVTTISMIVIAIIAIFFNVIDKKS